MKKYSNNNKQYRHSQHDHAQYQSKMQVTAIDIGATKTALAVLENGVIEPIAQFPTAQDPHQEAEEICSILNKPPFANNISAIGIGCPGPLNPHTGTILKPPNLPQWDNFSLTEKIAANINSSHNIPIRLENDANLGALGEAMFGSAAQHPSMFYLTLSTGIGAGLIIDGNIIGGYKDMAGEVYGFRSSWYAGANNGATIIERASGPGIVRSALKRIQAGESTILSSESLTTKSIFSAADKADPLALSLLEDGRNAIAALLVNAILLVAPSAIVLAGGLCTKPRWFVDPIRQRVAQWLNIIPELTEIPIYRAKLWDTAVLYGAGYIASTLIPS